MPELQTEDLLGVEIVRAGGPFRGTGSKPGGDYLSVADLEGAAAAFAELRDELRSPLSLAPRGKLGHNDAQDAAREAGFLGGDGAPAVGWLDNLRVEGDRLLADMRKVPKMVAELVRAGAYRARSVEFWKGYVDQSGKRHPMVITGLALLGAKLPAVRGLNDLVALYGDVAPADGGAGAQQGYLTTFADGTVDPEGPEPAAGPSPAHRAGGTEAPTDARDGGPAPSSAAPADGNGGAAGAVPNNEREGKMPGTIPADLRAALGVDDAAGDDAVTAAAVKLADDSKAATAEVESVKTKLSEAEAATAELQKQLDKAKADLATAQADGDTRFAAVDTELQTLREQVKLGESAASELATMRRDAALDKAIEDRKLAPAQREEWARRYDENPTLVTSLLDGLTPRTDLAAGEAGSDDKGGETDPAEDDATYARAFGEAPLEPSTKKEA